MAHEHIGTLQIGNTPLMFWNDGGVYDVNGKLLGTYVNNNDGTVTLNTTEGDSSTVSYDGTNYILTNANDEYQTANWTEDPNWSGNMQTPTPFSTNTQSGLLTYDDVTYQVVDDGSGGYQLWNNGKQEGYAVADSDTGMWNVFSLNSTTGEFTVPSCTIDPQTGAVMGADDKPLEPVTFTPADSGPDTSGYKGTLTWTGPDGQTITGYMDYYGRIVDPEGKTLLTYRQTGNNEYQLFNLDDTEYGSYNSQSGTLTYKDGSTATVDYNPMHPGDVPPYGIQTYTDTATNDETLTTDKTGATTSANTGATTSANTGATTSSNTGATTSSNTGATTSSNTGATTSASGIDWGSPVASALLPSITEGALALPGLAKTAGTQAQEKYTNLMNQAMGPQAFQGYLNQLGKQGILNSSVAEGALSRTAQGISQDIGNKAFDASIASTDAQMKVPGYLSSITGQLGGTTGATTSTGTGTTTSTDTGTATTTGSKEATRKTKDPNAPLKTYIGLMNL